MRLHLRAGHAPPWPPGSKVPKSWDIWVFCSRNRKYGPAPPKCPLRNLKYHLIETMRPLLEVHSGVYLGRKVLFRLRVGHSCATSQQALSSLWLVMTTLWWSLEIPDGASWRHSIIPRRPASGSAKALQTSRPGYISRHLGSLLLLRGANRRSSPGAGCSPARHHAHGTDVFIELRLSGSVCHMFAA